MRVVHLIKATRIGGAERHLLILLTALRARGIDAHLLMLVEPTNPMTNMLQEAQERGIPIQSLTIGRDYDPFTLLRIRRALVALRPDLVHTHLIHADIWGLPAAKLAGVKTVISGRHNDDEFRHHALVRRLNALWWRGFTGGIAISESIRDFTIAVEGAPPPKIRVVTYGFEYTPPQPHELEKARRTLREELHVPADTLLIGLACRLVEQKGVSYALQAFQQLYAEFPQVHCIIAGEGDLRGQLESEAQRLGIAARTHFLGWRANIPHLLAGLDVFLMPSLWEGFGLVLLEAMSKRVPIIASAVSAIPEVVQDGETGLLVPPRDPSALAEALRRMLPDRALRAYLGLNGEDRLEALFSADRMAQETIQAYTAFLGER
jgi:glycosyltransferase involved in cell wall biosynthesis